MPSRPLDLFLFDLAGTTVRDDGYVMRAFRQTADRYELKPTDEWLRARMGQYKQSVFAELLRIEGRDESQSRELSARFDEFMQQIIRENPPRPLPGAEESIHLLRELGASVGFTTGFTRATADLIVRELDWNTEFCIASDEVASGRPAPDMIQLGMRRARISDPGRVGVAGDTPSDLLAGTNARCGFVVGVGHGTHTLDELRPFPHTHLLPDLTRLGATIGLSRALA